MNKMYKISSNTKRIMSIFLLFLQMRFVGLISNSVNKDAVKDYYEIISEFSDFLRNEEIDDPQLIYEYYNYAMWNGYFSHDHELQYALDRKAFFDNAGMSIMSSNAVCLNYADMLSLIFKEMGFNSYVVLCYVDPDNVDSEPIRTDKKIERSVDSSSSDNADNIFIETITKISGNHAITCVENNGELYFFDPTNLMYLNKTGINNLSIINGEGKFDIKYFNTIIFENINIFKVIPYTNEYGYNEEIIEKQTININYEELENFYNSQKENIENIDKNNDDYKNIFSMITYSMIAVLVIDIIFKSINKLANKFKNDDIKYLFPKLKEYFNEKNIKTEFETLKNYELIEKKLGIKDDISKDIIKKIILYLDILFSNKNIYPLMLVNCLTNLGYNATICEAKKYTNKLIKKDIPLIIYYDQEKVYIYDYETEELLCNNNNILSSLDGKYKYEIDYHKYKTKKIKKNMNKVKIKNKMDNENNMLNEEDIKQLRRTRTLRY